jgi:hypothetical protein
MSAYTDIFDAATNPEHPLRKQTAVGMHKQALGVLAEAPSVENHNQRVALAQRVLKNPEAAAAVAIWRILENPTIAGAPTTAGDGLVLSVCALAWDVLSKVQV